MKKMVSFMLALVLSMGLLTGCGGSTSENNVVTDDSQQGSTAATSTSSLLDQIIEEGKISIAVFSDVTPLGYMDENNELTGSLLNSEIEKIILDKEKCLKMGENAYKVSNQNVEEKIYREIDKLVMRGK